MENWEGGQERVAETKEEIYENHSFPVISSSPFRPLDTALASDRHSISSLTNNWPVSAMFFFLSLFFFRSRFFFFFFRRRTSQTHVLM